MPHPENPRAKTRPNRHSPRRTDRGLTTLEWLLIVAAVAGLAALAVVLVQNVVDDTAEQISGSSARLTAAKVAAQEINEECNAAGSDTTTCEASSDEANLAKEKCLRLTITYGDAFEDANIDSTLLVASSGGSKTWLWDTMNRKCQIPPSTSA